MSNRNENKFERTSTRFTVYERKMPDHKDWLFIKNPTGQLIATITPEGADIYEAIQEMIRFRGDGLAFTTRRGRLLYTVVAAKRVIPK